MFTGIIESVGVVKKLLKSPKSLIIGIEPANPILNDVKTGDSIAANGVCLTVTSLTDNSFEADVMDETVKVTSLSSLTLGSSVNLERALRLSDRLGGHIVSGHIDGTGTISNITQNDIASIVRISADKDITKYIIKRGSIALDGISLTVTNVADTYFEVGIIPHTGSETTLLSKKIGDIINIETDTIAKYVEKLLIQGGAPSGSITEEFLRENGF